MKLLNKELYGEAVSWSEELQGGLENDVKSLNDLIVQAEEAKKDSDKQALIQKQKDLIKEWHDSGKHKYLDSSKKLITEPIIVLSLI
jgi:hypothetical protein